MIVKICGIRTIEAAQTAAQAGADMLGFIFVPESRRCIDLSSAKNIMKSMNKRVKCVGVFKNQPREFVETISQELDLDYVQLHGSENTDYVNAVPRPVIKAIVSNNHMYSYTPAFYLLDRAQQGAGPLVDTNMANSMAQHYPLLFAGGLTPENVSDIIRAVRPAGVDVAGGVETHGQHDAQKIISFIKSAKSAI